MTAKSKRSSEPRRANKPLMEKRRRARINQSLAALKALILDSAKADNTKHSKLEKADILELTVRHFQRHRSLEGSQGVQIQEYRAGYADCVREVRRYLDTPDAQTMALLDDGVRQRLLQHLDNCVSEVDNELRPAANGVNAVNAANGVNAAHAAPAASSPPATPATTSSDTINTNPDEVNNNSCPTLPTLPNKVARTADGSFVFVLPSHYLQIASALGINLRPQSDQGAAAAAVEAEKPLDFSKNNELRDMWRPW